MVRDTFKLYVPTPPVPVPSDEMLTVNGACPKILKFCPTASVPFVTAVTVITVPAIVAVNTAAGVKVTV